MLTRHTANIDRRRCRSRTRRGLGFGRLRWRGRKRREWETEYRPREPGDDGEGEEPADEEVCVEARGGLRGVTVECGQLDLVAVQGESSV